MRFIAIAFCICFPVMVLAERVVVRSGEHADFSRLVFEFNNPVEWEMGRVAQGYEIRLKNTDEVVDISGVYQRIPRDRIKALSVSTNSTRITLALGCECHADAFEFRQGVLVVDIKDGPPTRTSGFETVFTSDETSTAQVKPPEPVETRGDPSATSLAGVKEHLPPLTQLPRRPTKPRVGAFAESSVKDVQDSAERISHMQSEMLHQIGRAAAQGLLDANLPRIMQQEPVIDEPSTVVVQKEAEPTIQPHVNIHVESSVDREFVNMLPTHLMTEDGTECMPGEMFNVVEWGDPDSVFDQIIVQRSKISGEFDKVDKHAVAALVKAYIYAGFGAEAKSALNAFDVTLKDANTLRVMAQIVDGTAPAHNLQLAGQAGCDSAVALWAVLAKPKLSKGMEINRTSILGAFSGLPFHLRRLLGPRLSQKFLDIDDVETARALRNAIARAPGDAGPEFRLLDAKLDQVRGMHSTAEQALEDIVAEDSSVAPKALIALMEAKLEQKTEIGADLLVSAQSYAFEQKNTETSANLKRVIALAHGKSGDFSAALEMLLEMKESGLIDTKEIGQTWERILIFAVTEAPDEAFLQFIFASRNDLEHLKIARDIRRKVAARLLDGHFSEMATILLAAPVSPTADDRMLLARVATIENRPEDAIAILKHVSGEKAARLRAHAFEISGKHLDAAREYAAIQDLESQQSEVWRAGDWEQLGEFGSTSQKAAAQFMIAENSALGTVDEETGKGGVLLETSSAARHSIETLLEEHPTVAQEGS